MSTRTLAMVLSCGALLSLAGCWKGDEGKGDKPRGDTGEDCVDEDATARAVELSPLGLVCEVAPSCISLPEAHSRGMVAFSYDGSSLVLENIDTEQEVCIEGWFLVSSEESQDSGFGDPDDDDDDSSTDTGDPDTGGDEGGSSTGGSPGGGSSDGGGGDDDDDDDDSDDDDDDDDSSDDCEEDEAEVKGGRINLAPAQALYFAYASATPDTNSWWCVEQTQVTQYSTNFDFTGEQMPGPLAHFAVDQTDEDGDGVEDHVDYEGGYYQTNLNIWEFEATHPVFSVGRTTNYIELLEGESQPVELTVTNMGRAVGRAVVTEVVPHGVEASNFNIEPVDSWVDAWGRTHLAFEVELAAAVDTDSYTHTVYSAATITYDVQMAAGATCPLRHVGKQPSAEWADLDGVEWESLGPELVISCCVDEGSGKL